jgi:Flp pilus assembly pilin Flp
MLPLSHLFVKLGVRDMKYLRSFLREEQGQDLVEYTLLLAFVALASAALFIGAGGSIRNIWTNANGILSNAASAAS